MLPEQFLEPSIIFFRIGWEKKSRWTKVKFDGAVLAALDIKRCIMEYENLQNAPEVFDLVLTNTQTGEDFREEGFLVPRNSALVARKIPCNKEGSDRIREPPLSVDAPGGHTVRENIYGGGRIIGKPTRESDAAVADFFSKGEDYTDVIETHTSSVPGIPNPREDLANGAFGFGGMRFAYRFDPQAKPPPGYICHRCDQPGHFIRFCPTNEDPDFNFKRIKPATGIPLAMLKTTDRPLGPLESLTSSKNSDYQSVNVQTERVPDVKGVEIDRNGGPELRDELICKLCKMPFVNAVMTTCCFASFCDVCIRLHLLAKLPSKCPNCQSLECQEEDLKPSRVFQKSVDDFVEKYPYKANIRITRHFKSQPGVLRTPINQPVDFISATPFQTSSSVVNPMSYSRGVNPNNTCFRCGERGHYIANCLNRSNRGVYNPTRSGFGGRSEYDGSYLPSHEKKKTETPRYSRKRRA